MNLTKFFYEYLLPLALTFGMPSKEFWEEDPELMWAYQKSYIDKNKINKETMNIEAWLNGFYVYDAVNKAIYNSFRKKGVMALEYMQEPIDLNKTKEMIEKEKILSVEEKIKERNAQIKQILKERGKTKDR